MTSFKPMFEKMSQNKDIDFWGNTQNIAFKPHIQSYFMVFRKPVINSKKFASFINNVTHQINNAGYIANYEIQLPSYLANFGYKWDTYIPYQELSHLKEPDNNSYPLTLIRDYNNQFLKYEKIGVGAIRHEPRYISDIEGFINTVIKDN
jgi:rhamnosyltransferase